MEWCCIHKPQKGMGVIRMFDELDNAIDKMMEEQNKLLDDAYQ